MPYPQYLKCMAALVCRPPPLSYILFPCCGVCWSGCTLPVTIFTHSPYYWKLLEPPGTYTTLGFSWICPTPNTYALPFSLLLETIGAIWNLYDRPNPTTYALAFSLLLETIGTTWNLYEPRMRLDAPCPPVPEMYGCTDVQVPPLSYITNHDKQKTRSWCWGVNTWGRRILSKNNESI